MLLSSKSYLRRQRFTRGHSTLDVKDSLVVIQHSLFASQKQTFIQDSRSRCHPRLSLPVRPVQRAQPGLDLGYEGLGQYGSLASGESQSWGKIAIFFVADGAEARADPFPSLTGERA